MIDHLTFFMDESGFTGEDLMIKEQPIFALASTTLSEEKCKQLKKDFFGNIQAPELKHSVISKYYSGQKRIVDFLKAIHNEKREYFFTWLVHKEFSLLVHFVDSWVEWAAHEDGVDLYKDGAALALSNYTYYFLKSYKGSRYLEDFLGRFQKMMRIRTLHSFNDLLVKLEYDFLVGDEETKEALLFFLHSMKKLGFQHLIGLPKRIIDPALSGLVMICINWRRQANSLSLIHDRSSNLAKDRDTWERITSPKIDEMVVTIPGGDLLLPLNVKETLFEDSRSHLQIQFCDLIAGATATWARHFDSPDFDEKYCKNLEDAGIRDFLIDAIYPRLEVDPEKLGKKGWSGQVVETLTEHYSKNKRI